MTVHQLVGEQEPGKRESGSVTAEKIAPLTRARLSGSESGNHHARNRGASRREFLIYAWAGTLAAMTMGSGVAAYQFLYPRRRANTFGGVFQLGAAADLPPVGSDPSANVDGKFWLINNEVGPRAYYNICTHPWFGKPHQYRWDPEASRFQCPVCGSRFSREGHYQEGPAPRSLDQFVIEVVFGRRVFAKTKRLSDETIAPVVPSPEAKILIDTGKIIEGFARMESAELRGNSLEVVPGEFSA